MKYLVIMYSTIFLAGCVAKASDCSNKNTIDTIERILAETIATQESELISSNHIEAIQKIGNNNIIDYVEISHIRSNGYEKEINKYSCAASVSLRPRNVNKTLDEIDLLVGKKHLLLSLGEYGRARSAEDLYDFLKSKYNRINNSFSLDIEYFSQREKNSENTFFITISEKEVVALQTIILWGFYEAEEVKDIDVVKHKDQIASAVNTFLDIQREQGVLGAVSEVQKCYHETEKVPSEQKSIYCLSLDTASSQYISFLEKQNGWPQTEFFMTSSYVVRVANEFERMGISKEGNSAKEIHKKIQAEVNEALGELISKLPQTEEN